jgi:phage terminase large subunit-like protein
MSSQALPLLFSLPLPHGVRWGEVAAPFQIRDASAILDFGSATPYHFLTRARGGSKTTDLGAIGLVVMLTQAPPGARLYALAADRDQGTILIDSIRDFASSPAIAGLVEIFNYEVRVPSTGVILKVMAADAPGAYGLRPHFLIIDELAVWADTRQSRKLLDAVLTAASKGPNCRLVVLTTAGSPSHFSYELLQHAYSDPLWDVNEAPGAVPWLDPERLAEQERGRTPAVFRRQCLNEWTEDDDRLANREDLEACVLLAGPQEPQSGLQYAIGLDIGIVNDRTALAVCHLEPLTQKDSERDPPRRTVVLDRLIVWSGTRARPVQLEEVAATALTIARMYRTATLVFDPYQAVGMTQQLRGRGVRIEQVNFTTSVNGQLATTLYQLIRNRALVLPDDPELLRELLRVRIRESTPGVPRLDHDAGQHDDRAIALALAANWLLEHPPGSGPRLRALVGR